MVKINKDYFVKSSSILAKTAIFTAFPYLNFPPVNFLINQAINWTVGKIADGLELSAFFVYIDFRIDKQGREYADAARAAEIGQTEELRIKADEAFKAFAHFNNY